MLGTLGCAVSKQKYRIFFYLHHLLHLGNETPFAYVHTVVFLTYCTADKFYYNNHVLDSRRVARRLSDHPMDD